MTRSISILLCAFLAVACVAVVPAEAAGFRDQLLNRKQVDTPFADEDEAGGSSQAEAKAYNKQADLAYGTHERQKLDVYLPVTSAHAVPIILMVHGGAWMIGDKSIGRAVTNKANHYVGELGYIFASTNYRFVPEVTPLDQADDVAAALAYVQSHAAEWGGDPDKVILMGHSAGAHLAALLSADPARAAKAGAKRWVGTVALDSGAMNVPAIMARQRHYRFYNKAFGQDPAFWTAASPYHQLKAGAVPLLAVCSSTRPDKPCAEGQAYVAKARGLGIMSDILPQEKSHGAINKDLGLPGAYTAAVDAFIVQQLAR